MFVYFDETLVGCLSRFVPFSSCLYFVNAELAVKAYNSPISIDILNTERLFQVRGSWQLERVLK